MVITVCFTTLRVTFPSSSLAISWPASASRNRAASTSFATWRARYRKNNTNWLQVYLRHLGFNSSPSRRLTNPLPPRSNITTPPSPPPSSANALPSPILFSSIARNGVALAIYMTQFYGDGILTHRATPSLVPREQRFLSGMAFSVYEVVRVACLSRNVVGLFT